MEPIERRRELEEGIRRRMREWALERLRLTMVEIAEKTGESYKNVQNWMAAGKTMPAAFVAAFVEAIPVNRGWLLTGEGRPEPLAAEPKVRAFDRIAAIVTDVLEGGGGDGDGDKTVTLPPPRPELDHEKRPPGARQRRA